jgi:secreted trypsin-like serine protease
MPGRLAAACSLAALAIVVVGHAGARAVPDRTADPARDLVVGGGKANAQGWSFATALKLRRSAFFCAGALVSPAHVVTAAHCVQRVKRRKLLVATGSTWLSGRRAAPRLPVARIRIHPRYNGRKAYRDVAVVTLARPSAAEPIQLPTAREAKATTKAGDVVRVAGWGARSPRGFRSAQRLKSARERVHRPSKCKRAYGRRAFQTRSMICAVGGRVRRLGGFRATDCFGDSGGPLVAPTPAGPRLVGVVSVGGFPCGRGPSIYARVSAALPFIRRATGLP